MPNLNGLIAPPAYKNPEVPYYAKSDQPEIYEPVLISPVTVQSGNQLASAFISVEGATGVYKGALNFTAGANSPIPAADALTMRSIAGGVSVEVGTNSQTNNELYIAGPSGLSQVNDPVYNPAVSLKAITLSATNPLAQPDAGNEGEIFRCVQAGVAASAAAAIGTNFQVPVSGWYALQIEVQLGNAPAPAAASINVPITVAPGGVNLGETLTFAITKGVVVEPYGAMEYSSNEFAVADILVAGGNVIKQFVSMHLFDAAETYTFTLKSSSAVWNIGANGQMKAELIAMC